MIFAGKAERRALESWRRLAPHAGFEPGDFRVTRRWRRGREKVERIVLKLEDRSGMAVIVKRTFAGELADFQRACRGHEVAAEALARDPRSRVPEIFATDEESRTVLMSFAKGETLRALCRDQPDPSRSLTAAGRWLSAYHSATATEIRPFRPRYMAKHLDHLADEVESGARKIHEPARFVRLARLLAEMAPDFDGMDSRISAKHGDMNSQNLLICGEIVTGYDFLGTGDAPVGYDIARLLLSHMATAGDAEATEPGRSVVPRDLAAFFEGYGFVGPDDPGVRYLTLVQLATDWNRIGHDESLAALLRFGRLSRIADRAFGI